MTRKIKKKIIEKIRNNGKTLQMCKYGTIKKKFLNMTIYLHLMLVIKNPSFFFFFWNLDVMLVTCFFLVEDARD